MKHLRNLVLFVMLASAQFAYSAAACDPCDPCNTATECDLCNVSFCDMEFELYVDALYWHADGSRFELEDGDSLCSDYNWGWRIGGSAYWNSWDFGFRYTSLDASTKKTIQTVAELIVHLEHEVDYQVFDLEVGRSCCICEGILFRPFLGARFAEVKQRFSGAEVKQRFSGSEEGSIESFRFVQQKFTGEGLYIGFDNRWQICSFNVCDRSIPVALVSRVSTGVLDGDFKFTESKGEYEYKDCQFVPVHELYAGLEFRMCDLCGVEGFMQLGYEAQYWGWKNIDDPEDAAHLGLGGMVLRFGARF